MAIARKKRESDATPVQTGVLSLEGLQRIASVLSVLGPPTFEMRGYEADSIEELKQVPGARAVEPIQVQVDATEDGALRLSRVVVTGRSVHWWDAKNEALAAEVAATVQAALPGRLNRWAHAAAVPTFMGVVAFVAFTVLGGALFALVPSQLVVMLGVIGVLLVKTSGERDRLRVQLRAPEGLRAKATDSWPDWLFGGVVAGLIVTLFAFWLD